VAGFDDPAFYGDRWAGVYDEHFAEMDPAAVVDFLAGLAGGGRVLELAIGTGRVALPLAGRGIAVEGIDASEAMVERLRAKPGGDSIPVVIGDMAQVLATGPFSVVYLVFNTLFGLLSQARQAQCFRNVARVLDPGGVFVIECFVPDLTRFDRGQRVQARAVTEDSAILEVSRHDGAHQRIATQIVTIDGHGTHLRPVALRYCWPSELDLMAQQAGLRLRERYSGWDRQPFDSNSRSHVSVYQPDWRHRHAFPRRLRHPSPRPSPPAYRARARRQKRAIRHGRRNETPTAADEGGCSSMGIAFDHGPGLAG
jgi:SAM-dependent methyltransferase